MDCREDLLRDTTSLLIAAGLDTETLVKVRTALTTAISRYDISESSTALVTQDIASENLLQLYAGTMLTEGKSRKTVQGYISFLHRFMRDIQKPLVEVNAFDIRIWFANMQTAISERTCENYRAYLSAFYHFLTIEDIVKSNVMDKIKPIKYSKEVLYPFTEPEIDAIRSACDTLRDRAIVELLLSSGIRVSELCGLDRADVDFDSLTITVRKGKGGKQRTTYITDVCKVHLLRYLDSRTDNNPALFIQKYGLRHKKNSVENDLHRIGKRANVPDVHPHRCRRTFATTMYKRGMDIHTIQRLMGHSDINTTMCYITTSDQRTQNEYRRFA